MPDVDEVAAAMRALVPDLPQPEDRFDRVRARVARRRRRRLAVPSLAAAVTAAMLLVVQPLRTGGREADSQLAAPSALAALSASPWYLYAYSGNGGRTSALYVPASTLTFDASGGFTAEGCGSTSGRVSVTGDRLTFSNHRGTEPACKGPEVALQQAVDRVVQRGAAWSTSSNAAGSELTLATAGGERLTYWSSPKPTDSGLGVAWPSCDVLAADRKQQEAGGPPLIPAVPVPASFDPVGVVRCPLAYATAQQGLTGTGPAGGVRTQDQSTDATAVARLALALQQPDDRTPNEMACAAIGYDLPRLLLVDATGRHLYAHVPRAVCGRPQDAVTQALAQTAFTTAPTSAFPSQTTTSPTSVSAASSCSAATPGAKATVSAAFATTAGVVKARRVGPSPSPAAAPWAAVADDQPAYWCELRTAGSYSVVAVTGGEEPVAFVTSNVSLLAGPEGPLVP